MLVKPLMSPEAVPPPPPVELAEGEEGAEPPAEPAAPLAPAAAAPAPAAVSATAAPPKAPPKRKRTAHGHRCDYDALATRMARDDARILSALDVTFVVTIVFQECFHERDDLGVSQTDNGGSRLDEFVG